MLRAMALRSRRGHHVPDPAQAVGGHHDGQDVALRAGRRRDGVPARRRRHHHEPRERDLRGQAGRARPGRRRLAAALRRRPYRAGPRRPRQLPQAAAHRARRRLHQRPRPVPVRRGGVGHVRRRRGPRHRGRRAVPARPGAPGVPQGLPHAEDDGAAAGDAHHRQAAAQLPGRPRETTDERSCDRVLGAHAGRQGAARVTEDGAAGDPGRDRHPRRHGAGAGARPGRDRRHRLGLRLP